MQWAAVLIGRAILKAPSYTPRGTASCHRGGAGPLGGKVARALQSNPDQGTEFVGYFDDRTDSRVLPEAVSMRLGGLRDVANYVYAHGVHEVYITLPLGSQPRIVELLEGGTRHDRVFVFCARCVRY